MSDELLGAIIGGVTTLIALLLGIWIRDFVLHKRNRIESEKKIYQKYSKPLQKSLEKLNWRLIEILKSENLVLDYDEDASDYFNYKYISTLYRFMSVLAWLRMAGRDLTYYKISRAKDINKLNESIFNYKSSIADGTRAEKNRLQSILKYSESNINSFEGEELIRVGNLIDNLLLQKCSKEYHKVSNKQELVEEILNVVESELNVNIQRPITEELISCTLMTECWIYRDWQDAMGDFMIDKSNETEMKVIGFKEFEDRFKMNPQSIWIFRCERLFKNFSNANDPNYDYRVTQIKDLLVQSWNLLLALEKIKVEGSVIKATTKSKMKTELGKIGLL